MESSVTRLLVATKMLLEALTKWSLGQRTETQVSDIYVRLGNDFNTAKVAFSGYGIDMRYVCPDIAFCTILEGRAVLTMINTSLQRPCLRP